MKIESRIKNTKRNIVMSYANTIVTILFQFISRTLIVNCLGAEYLGLSSLFTSILQVLNMAELGFSGAIVFHMYQPLAEGNTQVVSALLAFYKKVYRIVGCVVFVAGILLMPFLPRLINSALPEDVNLYVLYFIYLVNTSVSYVLFAYKSALLEALQRMDLVKMIYVIVNGIQYLVQILVLIIFKSFYGFVLTNIAGTIAKNLFAASLSNKRFPEYQCKGTISKDLKKDIISRVKGLLVCNISGVTYTTFDSIILSSFLGLTSVAVYNNYLMIFTGVGSFISLIRNAMQASVGNSVATESVEKNYNDMLLWQFLFSVIATWCTACMLCLYQPFMTLWMGSDMLLSTMDVVLICFWFAIGIVQHSFYLYLSANGLWWEMRKPYIMSTVCNLIMNCALGKLFGTTGIIFSSAFSSLVFGLLWQSRIIFRYYFKHSTIDFLKRQLVYFAVLAFVCMAAYTVCGFVRLDGMLGLIIKALICGLLSIVIMYAFYCKTKIFSRAKKFLRNVIAAV